MNLRRNTTTGTRTADREPALPVRTNVKAGFLAANHNEVLAPDQEVLARLRVQALTRLGDHARIQGRLVEAETVLWVAHTLAETHLGTADPDTGSACNALGIVAKYAARFDQARVHYQCALAVLEARQGVPARVRRIRELLRP